jgi:hypothetical protein
MLYAINRGNVATFSGQTRDVVYLVSSVEKVVQSELVFAFTDGNAAMQGLTRFFKDLSDLQQVDWPLMQAKYRQNTPDDHDRMRRRQAEFLVRDQLPWQVLIGIAVYAEDIQDRVLALLDPLPQRQPVRVRPNWYF